MGNCPRCYTELIWQSDFMTYEVYGEGDENDSSITSYFVCPNCGATITVVDPYDDEKKNYPFWND